MDKKKKPSGAFKRKQRQEREDSKQKLPKIDKFFNQPSTSTSGQNISIDSDSNNIVTAVLVKKPKEEDLEDSLINAVGDTSAADHVNVDDVCITHIGADWLKEPRPSTFVDNVYEKSSYDLGNFTNKILSDNEKRQILDLGPLQPSGPFPTDINQNNRCFSKSYYVSCSKYGPVNRFWLCYSKILDAAYCQPCWLFASQRNNAWCTGIRDWKHLSEKIKQHSCSSGHSEACAVYDFWKKNNNTIDKDLENEIRKEASFWKMVLQRLFDIILTLAKSSLALRGHQEDLSQEGYHGNFLSFVELVARYDHTLQQVLNMPKGSIRYLSAKIQNEMIESLGTKLETHLLEQITASPFFAIIMDTTQDISKVPLALRRTKIKQEREKTKEKEPEPAPAPRGRRKPVRSYVDDDLDDVPLKNIKKEIREETVSMERYYFGQLGGKGESEKVAIAVECPECHIEFNNNIDLMEHLFSHATGSEPGAAPCRYCLQRFPAAGAVDKHLAQDHPSDTKTPDLYTYACLICEVRFAAVLTLATHMQKTHAPLELPYNCDACDYRSSSHRRLLDHFRSAHGRHHSLQCPACLKVIQVYSEGYELSANVRLFLDHLRQHQDKELEVRCNRCVLKFVHLGQLKEHQVRDHKTVENAQPLCSEEHLINKPKTKARPPVKDSSSHTLSATYEDLTLVLPDAMMCRECDTKLDSDKHFLGSSSCTKCPYQSSCYRAMLRHSGYCAGAHSLEDAPRDAATPLHCVCGHCTTVGTDMLTHLLMCEHKSAYPSEERARANTARGETAPPTEQPVESVPAIADYAPPSVLNTQLSLDDLAPPSVLQTDQHEQELLKDAYDRPLATPRHEEPGYSLGDFEPLPQEPPPQPDFEQL